jgi:TetR/AcrR family transcriptional regulator
VTHCGAHFAIRRKEPWHGARHDEINALVFENERLQERMNLLFDKLESAFEQSLHEVVKVIRPCGRTSDGVFVVAFMIGRMQRFARLGFKRLPSELASMARIL